MSPVSPVFPVSNGQGLEKGLKALAARHACTRAGDKAERKRFKLARDMRAIEKGIKPELPTADLMQVFDEWYRLSQPFLPADETRDDHLIAFLAELEKVRVPTGEGVSITKALENVSSLSPSQLPVIPGYYNAPEKSRRLAALHRELWRLNASKTYFLSYRAAAKVYDGLTHQEAHTITGALVRLGVIEIVRKGKAGMNSGKAAEFRYLLSHDESPGDDDVEIPV